MRGVAKSGNGPVWPFSPPVEACRACCIPLHPIGSARRITIFSIVVARQSGQQVARWSWHVCLIFDGNELSNAIRPGVRHINCPFQIDRDVMAKIFRVSRLGRIERGVHLSMGIEDHDT